MSDKINEITVLEYCEDEFKKRGYEIKPYNGISEKSVRINGKIKLYYVPLKKDSSMKLCLKENLNYEKENIKIETPTGASGKYTYPSEYPYKVYISNINNKIDTETIKIVDEILDKYCPNITNKENILPIIKTSKGADMTTPSQINHPLNQILYGPPGTGKTYNTVLKAMSIIDGCEYKDVEDEKYDELKIRFDELRNEHRIEFVTFHQSYSYEEFVEGIKPDIKNSENLTYKLEDGIFKNICNNAQIKLNNFEICYENFINDLMVYCDEKNEPFLLKTKGNRDFGMKVNSNNNLTLFLGPDLQQSGTLTKENLQKCRDWKYYANPILNYLKEKYGLELIQEKETKPYVLIIDEINRGDVSKIFGELITLIEEDKRIGNKYQMTTTLPYSKEAFGVPNNLFIIGTMNTADRSIALLDTALRRRFEFEEIMPKPEILNNQNIEGIDLQKLLANINKRICEKYDRDHQIGHSYLMNITNKEQLIRVYENKILPLLNEYFYNDTKTVTGILNCSENDDLTNCFDVLNKAQNN